MSVTYRIRTAIRLALVLGVLSATGLVAAFLALTDIGHGEPDLTLEWNVLRVSALLVVAFHVLAFRALRQADRALQD